MTVEQILNGILEREGGYIEHPADRGGPTKYGITTRTLEAWYDRPVTAQDVQALTADEARQIYRRQYVEMPGLDTIPEGPVLHQLVDSAVLSGPRQAVMDLQTVLHVRRDGILGPATRGALAAAAPVWVNAQLARVRTERLVDMAVNNPSQLVFLRGWVRRALSFL